ncbi:cobyrinate a,c-diamide synthase [uncultured Ruminococcus sp.]|uniref:cobyrinate a,c-diamide synthase n=1 Tax=uncultured Ruminococcus sp. TaxID=165186 RepID=UPI0025DA5105|nr:cobyrinate a,c-diamide synthase [uncultured Ruminococcus sp.]
MKRILIGGTNSGCGKTTIVCAILAALKARGLAVSSFKCGPDYIDPMFHKSIIGADSYNLDSFFCNDNTLKHLLCENDKNSDISVIEGVMGFYDGVNGQGSAHSVSMVTGTSSVIVIDCKGASESIGAVMKGFMDYEVPNRISGFIFNRLPERLVPLAKELCERLGSRYFGFFPVNGFSLESRRLGLVTAAEVTDLKAKTKELGELAEKHILLDELIAASEAPLPEYIPLKVESLFKNSKPKIAVARDEAFCFIYDENIELLRQLGCDIAYFSPIKDKMLPENCCGLLLSGGYPELHAGELSDNSEMLAAIKMAVTSGMPTIAECGGFMYLHDTIKTSDGREYKMAGALSGTAYETSRLQRFGYVTLTASEDSLICEKGHRTAAHEFHYWDSTDCGSCFNAKKADGREWSCIHGGKSLYAGFPHLYFYSDISIAERFAAACAEFGGIYG